MRAWRVHEYGDYKEVLKLDDDVEDPTAPDDGVVIEVGAAALNFPDLLAIAGQYQVKPPLPFVPGIEAAGKVIEAGPNARFAAGDRVITSGFGGYGERMAAMGQYCFPIPDGMSDVDAAAHFVIYQTGYFGLVYRANLQAGETLLVHGGAGGVGTAAIQLGKALGATVIATAGSAEKLEVCTRAGADHVINYREEDFVPVVKKLTSGRGADVIYDPVGGEVFDKSTKCIAFSGRLLVIGFTSGKVPAPKLNRVLLKNISIVGLHWGNYQFHQPELIHETHDKLCEMYAEGAWKPVIWKELPFDELPVALDALRDRKSYGKIVVRPR